MKSKGVNNVLEVALESLEGRDEICLRVMRRANELLDEAYIELSCSNKPDESKKTHREILLLIEVIADNASLRLENAMVINRLITLILMKG